MFATLPHKGSPKESHQVQNHYHGIPSVSLKEEFWDAIIIFFSIRV